MEELPHSMVDQEIETARPEVGIVIKDPNPNRSQLLQSGLW